MGCVDDDASLRDQLTRRSADRPARVAWVLGLLVICLGAVALFGLTRGSDADETDVDPAYVAVLDEIERLQARLVDYQRDIGTLDAVFAESDDQEAERAAYEAGLELAAESLRLNVRDSTTRLDVLETVTGTPAHQAAGRASLPFEHAADWAAAYPDAVRSGDRSRLDEIDVEVAVAMRELCVALRSEALDAVIEPRVTSFCGEF